jgi:hypothetical protein
MGVYIGVKNTTYKIYEVAFKIGVGNATAH